MNDERKMIGVGYASPAAGLSRQEQHAAAERYYEGKYQEPGSVGGKASPISPQVQAEILLKEINHHEAVKRDAVEFHRSMAPMVQPLLRSLSQQLHSWFKHQGFWPLDHVATEELVKLKKSSAIALIHSEISELLEAVRKGDRDNEAEELADTLIRMLDYAGGFGIDLGQAFTRKMFENLNRPFKHNKEF